MLSPCRPMYCWPVIRVTPRPGMSSLRAPPREEETHIEPSYSTMPVTSPVRLVTGLTGSFMRAESTPVKMEGENEILLIMLSSTIDIPPPICPSQRRPMLSSKMLFTPPGERLSDVEKFSKRRPSKRVTPLPVPSQMKSLASWITV